MPTTYSRTHIYVVDTEREASERISRSYSVGSSQHAFLLAKFRFASMNGYDFPSFDDGGAWVTIQPSVKYSMALANSN